MKKLIFIIALFGITSCDKAFEEINTDKNSPTEAAPENLLNGISSRLNFYICNYKFS